MNNLTRVYNTQIQKAIQTWGKDVVIYFTSSSYPYGATALDPVNHEPVSFTYAKSITDSSVAVKGVVYSFLGNMSYTDASMYKYGFAPESDIRVTFWVDDVLLNPASVTGQTYCDIGLKFLVNGKYYTKKKSYRTGIDRNRVLIVNLDEIKNYA